MGSENSDKKTKKKSKKIEKSKGSDENIITDPRFSSVHWDPRFQNVPKHKAKVEIDSRFNRMFSDKRFGASSAPLDKRGKPKKLDQGNSLRHYYRLEEDKDKVKSKSKEEEEEEENKSESEELGELGGEESDDDVASGDSETTTDTDTDDEDYDDEEEVYEDGVPEIEAEDVPEIEKETHRLAIVNLDWRHVKAVDLFAVLRSFLPKGGEIKSVAVYPSEFGLEHMKEEELHGPVGLFDDENEKSDEEDDDDDELDAQKLRAYEKSKLRYYYAVVECDSISTADCLYKNCDGVEFERSSNKLDLRFIPDSMEFKHPPRDVATEVPAYYVGLDFQTQALQQSKIDISWDEDDPARKTLKRKFTDDQLSELELKEYLASDESESDEDENDAAAEDKSDKKSKKRDMYLALIQSGDGDGDASDGDGEDDNDQDMEITFNTGLDDISKRILEKKDKESETVWEAYLRKKREKKKARKNRSKDSSEDESSDTDQEATEDADDFFIEEPSVKKSKKGSKGKSKKEEKKHQDADREAEASRNELELLLADDKGVADTGIKGYNMKRKKTKGKKGKEALEEDKIPDIDYDDPRFSALFKSPGYALDPTDPQFKRSAAYARQVALRQQKGDREEVPEKEVKSDVSPSKIEKSSLIKSIKMKTQPFEGKMSKKEKNTQSKGKKEKKDKQEAPTLVEPVKKKKKTKA